MSSNNNNNNHDPNLDLLPPALRMAATRRPIRPSGTGGSGGTATTTTGRAVPSVRIPMKNKSFQLRKDQTDALAKIRCQPRQDMMAEDEQRKQTLLRRQTMKAKRQEELQMAQREEKSKSIMESMTTTTSMMESSSSNLAASISNNMDYYNSADPAPSPSWQRSSPLLSPTTASKRTSTLKQQAQAMREKVKALQLDNDDDDDEENGTAGGKPKHSLDIVQKKLEKVEKLMAKEGDSGSKEYKKLSKKRQQYQAELEEFQLREQQRADAIAQAKAEAEEAERMAQQAEQEEKEAAAAAAEHQRRRKEQESSAKMAEEARLLKERAEALKAKRELESVPPPPPPPPAKEDDDDDDDDDDSESEIEVESVAEQEKVEEEEVMDEKERIRQARIEEYRQKMAEKKEQEEAAQRKAEQAKEFKILKKKLQKLEGMISEAEDDGKDTTKLFKKKNEYISQLEEFDQWKDELAARQKAEQAERERKEREEAERQRKAALEQERRRKAEEEAERRREEAEKAQRELERLEKEREEEAQRLRVERLEKERIEREEAEARRIQDEERAAREAEEAEELAAREAEEAEQRAAREAVEAEERAAREAEMAIQRAEQDRLNAERRKQEEEENAQRREELREQTRAAEAQAASEEGQRPAAAATKAEASQDFMDLRNIPEPHSANTKKILSEIESLEDLQARLEKTLKQNGIAASEDIPYEVAKDKIAQLQEQMQALAVSEEDQFVVQKKYYSLEEELSKYVTAMMLTDEFAEEQRMAEEKWEASIEVDNIAALRKIRSYMPVNIRNMTEDELTNNPTPNGKMLPKAIPKKFKRTNVLQLLRVDPHDLERMHPSLIEGLRSTGLTLTERRALHEHLKEVGAQWQEMQQDPSIERKYSWFLGLKSKFKEMVTAYDKHVQEYGPPGNHPYAKRNDPQGGGCPMIGNQCPVKADAATPYDDDYGFTQDAEYEGSSSDTPTKAFHVKSKARINTGGAKAKDDALMASIRERLNLSEPETAIESKLLRELFFAEKRAINLEKQLTQNGIALPKEDISYAVAKAKVAEITEDIKEIASKMGSTSDMKEMMQLEKEYSSLSDDLEKYNNALMLTKEWALELLEKERQWEEGVRPDNEEALRKIRRHMPVNIKDLSEQDMIQGTTPNGKQLPQNIVRKFKRTNILQLVRMPPSMIEPMHPSSLEGMRSTGLTMTERRALHEHLKDLGVKWKAASNDKMSERKWMWHESLRSKFKELVDKYQKHVDEFGPPGNHPYAKARGDPGCPLLGKQCPLKADLEVDYSDDYGFPAEDVYNVEKVKKSNLLTVEELERRKQDDDWGYDAPAPKEVEPSQPPMAGLMAAIGSRGGDGGSSSTSVEPPKKGTGLIAAIAKAGDGSGGNSSRPPAPKLGGGLLAAIASKKGGGDDIQAKGGGDDNTGSNSTSTPAAGPAPVSPGKKKRMGGLLASITGRGKK